MVRHSEILLSADIMFVIRTTLILTRKRISKDLPMISGITATLTLHPWPEKLLLLLPLRLRVMLAGTTRRISSIARLSMAFPHRLQSMPTMACSTRVSGLLIGARVTSQAVRRWSTTRQEYASVTQQA